MLKSFEVHGMHRRDEVISATFHPDLNILTGRNGSGKTTLLKLLWYVISSNIEHALKEIPFNKLVINGTSYAITILRSGTQSRIEVTSNGRTRVFEDENDDEYFVSADEQANAYLRQIIKTGSLFFPTFRRLEGGFSLDNPLNSSPFSPSKSRSDIEIALSALSRRLTAEKRHIFVAAISTADIVNLLLRQYTQLSETSNELQKDTSDRIIEQIKSYKYDKSDKSTYAAESVLDTIRAMIESMDQERETTMAPLSAVQTLVEKLFQHSGIRIGSRLSFGDAATAINSDQLSAGEKQMLSFICYNAFQNESTIFIDEPELSLHVDWQRQLFPILQSQGTTNQFIIATHSPFIYSKYPDKEIQIGVDRGEGSQEID